MKPISKMARPELEKEAQRLRHHAERKARQVFFACSREAMARTDVTIAKLTARIKARKCDLLRKWRREQRHDSPDFDRLYYRWLLEASRRCMHDNNVEHTGEFSACSRCIATGRREMAYADRKPIAGPRGVLP